MTLKKTLKAVLAGLFSVIIFSGQPAYAAVLEPEIAPAMFPAPAGAIPSGPFAPVFPGNVDRAAGTSLESAGFDLRTTGEFPSRMMDALAQSAAASDARLVGLMPISPEFAPLGVTGGGRRGSLQLSSGFMSAFPGVSKLELLIVLMAMVIGSAVFLLRRRGRVARHPYAFGA